MNPENKEEATEEFYKISNAYEVLSDKQKRAEYDLQGDGGANGQHQGRPGHGHHNFDPFEQFRDFFQGGGRGGQNHQFNFNFGGGQQQQKPQGGQAMYDEKSGVVEITSQEQFAAEIDRRGDSVVVAKFYSSNCQHCQNMKEEWSSVAGTLESLIKVFAVNCVNHAQLCKRVGVREYPTIRLFTGRMVADYPRGEERKSGKFLDWISNNLPTKIEKIKNNSELRNWLNKFTNRRGNVLLFTDKSKISIIYKSLCGQFAKNIDCAVVLKYSPSDSALPIKPDRVPSLFYIHDPVTMEGEFFRGSLTAEILSLFFSRVVTHNARSVSIDRLTGDRFREGDCSEKDSSLCVILLGNLKDDMKLYSEVKSASERFSSDPVKFFWSNSDKFRKIFDTNSPIIAVKGKRKRYSTLSPGGDVSEWIEEIITGGSPLPNMIKSNLTHDEL